MPRLSFSVCLLALLAMTASGARVKTDVSDTRGIVCPFLAGLADHLDMTSDEDFQISENEIHSVEEKFGLADPTVRHLTSSALKSAGFTGDRKIDIRKLPEHGISHMHTTAIRFPLNERIGPNRSQYERLISHAKADEYGCISTGNLGDAISKVEEKRIPLEHSSLAPNTPHFTWAALILTFAHRPVWGTLCTTADMIKSLFLDGKFPKSHERVQPWRMDDLMSTLAAMR